MDNQPDLWRTQSVENFLWTIYLLQQEAEFISNNLLAQTLQIAPSSVANMIKRIMEIRLYEHDPEPLLEYRPYHGVRCFRTSTIQFTAFQG